MKNMEIPRPRTGLMEGFLRGCAALSSSRRDGYAGRIAVPHGPSILPHTLPLVRVPDRDSPGPLGQKIEIDIRGIHLKIGSDLGPPMGVS